MFSGLASYFFGAQNQNDNQHPNYGQVNVEALRDHSIPGQSSLTSELNQSITASQFTEKVEDTNNLLLTESTLTTTSSDTLIGSEEEADSNWVVIDYNQGHSKKTDTKGQDARSNDNNNGHEAKVEGSITYDDDPMDIEDDDDQESEDEREKVELEHVTSKLEEEETQEPSEAEDSDSDSDDQSLDDDDESDESDEDESKTEDSKPVDSVQVHGKQMTTTYNLPELEFHNKAPPRMLYSAVVANWASKPSNPPASAPSNSMMSQQQRQAPKQSISYADIVKSKPTKISIGAKAQQNKLEESWFVTPPPCFVSKNRNQGISAIKDADNDPFENLLIEHPSMSVFGPSLPPEPMTDPICATYGLSRPPSLQSSSPLSPSSLTSSFHEGSSDLMVDDQQQLSPQHLEFEEEHVEEESQEEEDEVDTDIVDLFVHQFYSQLHRSKGNKSRGGRKARRNDTHSKGNSGHYYNSHRKHLDSVNSDDIEIDDSDDDETSREDVLMVCGGRGKQEVMMMQINGGKQPSDEEYEEDGEVEVHHRSIHQVLGLETREKIGSSSHASAMVGRVKKAANKATSSASKQEKPLHVHRIDIGLKEGRLERAKSKFNTRSQPNFNVSKTAKKNTRPNHRRMNYRHGIQNLSRHMFF